MLAVFPEPFHSKHFESDQGFFFFFFSFSCAVFSDTVLTLKMLAATVSIAHPEQSDEKAVQM